MQLLFLLLFRPCLPRSYWVLPPLRLFAYAMPSARKATVRSGQCGGCNGHECLCWERRQRIDPDAIISISITIL